MPDSTRSGRWTPAASGGKPIDEGIADNDGRPVSTRRVGPGEADIDELRGRSPGPVDSDENDEIECLADYGPSPCLAESRGADPGEGPGEACVAAPADGSDVEGAASP
eukprot:4334699-Heterocapsa_arctica.AAC.1